MNNALYLIPAVLMLGDPICSYIIRIFAERLHATPNVLRLRKHRNKKKMQSRGTMCSLKATNTNYIA